MKFVMLILFLCLSTYIPRMLPALFMNKIQVSGKLATFLQLIPYTAMASLIFPAILYVDDNMCIGIIAGIVASVTALKKGSRNWCGFIECSGLFIGIFI